MSPINGISANGLWCMNIKDRHTNRTIVASAATASIVNAMLSAVLLNNNGFSIHPLNWKKLQQIRNVKYSQIRSTLFSYTKY